MSLFFFLGLSYFLVPLSCFSCFPSSEQTKLTYSNKRNKEITDLPTVNLLQGYWPSQWAAQYVAYVYLKERIGVNVSFYPSNDPLTYFRTPPEYDYPDFYYEFLKNGDGDLLFELWPSMEIESYYDEKYVIYGGYSNVKAESGWFLPQYFVDKYPYSILPYALKNNESLRNMFIDSYQNYGINWYNEISNIRNTIYNGTWRFDVVNYSRPIIFGSTDSYLISLYSYNLTKNLFDGDGLDWDFVTFGTEDNLSALVFDLYSKRLPFIVNLYDPHFDFATVVNSSSNVLMQFEKVALPRNPSNTVKHQCYLSATCQQPLDLLSKLGRYDLHTDFPEMVEFLDNYNIDLTEINEILQYYKNYSNFNINGSLSEHELWLKASCQWLKLNVNGTPSEWYTEVKRNFYADFKYSFLGTVIFMILFILLIILLIHSIIWLNLNVKYRMVKALTPYVSSVMTVGLILLCVGSIINLINPVTLLLCNVKYYFYFFGSVLGVSAPALKSYRIVMIFSNARKMKSVIIKDKHLLQYLAFVSIIQLILLILYTLMTIEEGTDVVEDSDLGVTLIMCNQNKSSLVLSIMYIFIFILLFCMVILSWNSRIAGKLYQESTCAILSSVSSILAFFIVFGFYLTTNDYNIIITVQSLLFIIVVIIVWISFYGKIMYNLYNQSESEREYTKEYKIKHGISDTQNVFKYSKAYNGKNTKPKMNKDEIHLSKQMSLSQEDSNEKMNSNTPNTKDNKFNSNTLNTKDTNFNYSQVGESSPVSPVNELTIPTIESDIFNTKSETKL